MNYARKAVLGLFCALALGACSILESLYDNSPQLVFWWLDGYLDFRSDQTPIVKEELRALQKWHRETQLPQALALIQELTPLAHLDLLSEQTCGVEKKVLQTLPEVIARVAPSIARVATSISAEQIKTLQSNFDKKNKEWSREWLSGTPSERLEHQTDKGLEQARDLYGRISNAQKLTIQNLAQTSGYEPQKTLAIKLYRQDETVKALEKLTILKTKSDLSAEALLKESEQIVRDWLNRAAQIKDPELLAYSERRLKVNCEAVASFHNTTTPEQRAKARAKLKYYEGVVLNLLKSH
jgi:hypothetical protein